MTAIYTLTSHDMDIVREIESLVFFDDELSNDQIMSIVNLTMHKMEYRKYTPEHARTITRIVLHIIDKYYSVNGEEREIIEGMIMGHVHTNISQNYKYETPRVCVCTIA